MTVPHLQVEIGKKYFSLFKILDAYDMRQYLEAVEGHHLGEGFAGHLVVLLLQEPLESRYRDSLGPPGKFI